MNETDEEQVQADVGKKRRLQFILVLLVAGIGLGWLVYRRSTHVYTDDARISTDLVIISSKVAGRIEHLAVKEGSQLQAGDTIVKLDSQETQLRL